MKVTVVMVTVADRMCIWAVDKGMADHGRQCTGERGRGSSCVP